MKIHINKPETTKAFCGHKNVLDKKYFMSFEMWKKIRELGEKINAIVMCKKCLKKADKK